MFKILKPISVILLSLFMISGSAFADISDREEAAAFAGFIRDLVHTTQTSKLGAICYLGSDEVSRIIAQDDRSSIDLSSENSKFLSCKAIYVSKNAIKVFGSEVAKFSKNKIMTIAIFDGFTESGGMVQVQMGRRSFELILNSKAVKDSGVRLSALSLSLVIN
jgi:hypothetical protein